MLCKICGGNFSHLDEHHVIPREYGGEKGPTVMICAQCHQSLHNQAKHFLAGKSELEFFPLHLVDKARPYVMTILRSALSFENRHDGVKPPKRLIITLQEPSLLVKAHKLKVDMGFKSLDAFFNALLSKLTSKYD